MPPTTNKQQTVGQVLTVLKRRYDPPAADERPALEQLLYGVLREDASRDQADRAFRNLNERFFDWNEIRVSQPAEIEAALEDLPDAAAKAARVLGVLQAVFEQYFTFQLDEIAKKGLKNAVKQLEEKFPHATDFAVAWVVQQALGGHALPIDAAAARCLRRLGVADSDEDFDALRTSLEHHVPKNKGHLFCEGLSLLAKDVCWEEEPHCSSCALRGDCPTGQERKTATPRAPRLKPR